MKQSRRIMPAVHVCGSLLAIGIMLWCIVSSGRPAIDAEEINGVVSRYERLMNPSGDKQEKNAKAASPSSKDETRKQCLNRITKRHIFSPPPPPVRLTGILGDKAYFGGGQGYGVGQSVRNAKILRIGADWVELEIDGKKSKQYTFGPPSSSSGSVRRTGPQNVQASPPGRGRMPGKTELTKEMIERFRSMPPERQKQALNHMPAELREKLKKAL